MLERLNRYLALLPASIPANITRHPTRTKPSQMSW